jgi:hypothetical protein
MHDDDMCDAVRCMCQYGCFTIYPHYYAWRARAEIIISLL